MLHPLFISLLQLAMHEIKLADINLRPVTDQDKILKETLRKVFLDLENTGAIPPPDPIKMTLFNDLMLMQRQSQMVDLKLLLSQIADPLEGFVEETEYFLGIPDDETLSEEQKKEEKIRSESELRCYLNALKTIMKEDNWYFFRKDMERVMDQYIKEEERLKKKDIPVLTSSKIKEILEEEDDEDI